MRKKELSLYIHIPFCVRKCLYCDFLSGPAGEPEKERYVSLLCREIAGWGKLLSGEYQLKTIFLGGGTPSCLPSGLLSEIGRAVRRFFSCASDMEFTIEANPGTMQGQSLAVWREMGINRVSLGLQSAQEEELRCLGRIHTYQEFLYTYDLLRESGWENINIDLMADIPGQTVRSYEDTLRRTLRLAPEHISSYSLIIEPGTVFFEGEKQGLLARASEEDDRRMYQLTKELLAECGYERYEISNYARAGYECRHNLTYWRCGDYLGLGLGASSCLLGCRFCVPCEGTAYQEYVSKIEQVRKWDRGSMASENGRAVEWDCVSPVLKTGQIGERGSCDDASGQGRTGIGARGLPHETWLRQMGLCDVTVRTVQMQMEEFFFLGLRLRTGISGEDFRRRFGREVEEVYGAVIERFLRQKLLAEEGFHDRIYLTDRGIDVSNQVLAEFLLD